jgi:hypothetical protein
MVQKLLFAHDLSTHNYHPLRCSLPWAPSFTSSGLGLFPRNSLAFGFPRLRGKAKWGVPWYEARGRKPPTPNHPSEVEIPPVRTPSDVPIHDHPPDVDVFPTLVLEEAITHVSPPVADLPPVCTSIEASIPSQPLNNPTTNLSTLSPLPNPYACRLEWFELFGNSLGYVPPLPSLPHHHPPPPFSPRHPHIGPALSLSTSSASPTSPGDIYWDHVLDIYTLSNLQRELRDIKWDLRELNTITLDMQNRDFDP